MTFAMLSPTLTEEQFLQISQLVKNLCGINLHQGKKQLVRARLSKRIRQLGMHSFQEYFDMVRSDPSGQELTSMLDALSTNLTSFYREPDHFAFLAERLIPRWIARSKTSKTIRIWSAGCSSGEEPYTLAMILRESLPPGETWDARILATDLSTRALGTARRGMYPLARLQSVPPPLRQKYFHLLQPARDKHYVVSDELHAMVRFARLNLLEHWPMQGPFSAIFCRNVMIYFDKPTQTRIIERFWSLLEPGGMLFVGHSESLAGVKHRFEYVQPTIYQKA